MWYHCPRKAARRQLILPPRYFAAVSPHPAFRHSPATRPVDKHRPLNIRGRLPTITATTEPSPTQTPKQHHPAIVTKSPQLPTCNYHCRNAISEGLGCNRHHPAAAATAVGTAATR